ncbi:MAG: CHAD domain-containing protein [Phycisphaerales bacterium JB039]
MAYQLRTSRAADDELRRILAAQAGRAARAAAGDDPHEAVHEVRRRCKKARAALRLARPALGSAFARENAFFRDVGRSISQLRDAQAVVEAIPALRERFADEAPAPVLDRAQTEMRARRDAAAAPDELRDALDRAGAELTQAIDRLASLPVRGQGFGVVAAGLRRTYRDGREAMKIARREPAIEALHEWRKRVKDHRYQISMLRQLWPTVMEARQAELHRLSDLLGADHDLATLSAILHSEDLGLDLEALMPLIERRRAELIAQAWPLGARLFAEKPGRFAKRIGALWAAAEASGPAPLPARVAHAQL